MMIKGKGKKPLCMILTMMFCITLSPLGLYAEDLWSNPYQDVTEEDYYYNAVTELNKNGIIADAEAFEGALPDSRGNFVNMLYQLYLRFGGEKDVPPSFFSDVPEDSPFYEAVSWATANSITSGISPTEFAPDATLTREQACAFMMRYTSTCKLSFPALTGTDQFVDSLYISYYARSYVTACKMAGLIHGYEDGYFLPTNPVTRAEAATMIYSLLCAQALPAPEGVELIDPSAEAYTHLYDNYHDIPKPFQALVEWNPAVDLSYFDDAVLIGDSVTLALQYYCAANGGLGNVTFLSHGSLSARTALAAVSSSSLHPSYRGTKMSIEEGVKQCGAKKVYIMLGINSLANGIDSNIGDLKTLVDRILQKSPDATIIIESVTPMTASSTLPSKSLTNSKIYAYNARLQEACQENGWYYLNVAEAVSDANGYLISSYSSDPRGMGIHFSNAGSLAWIDYLKTHVPEEFR